MIYFRNSVGQIGCHISANADLLGAVNLHREPHQPYCVGLRHVVSRIGSGECSVATLICATLSRFTLRYDITVRPRLTVARFTML